MLDKEKHKYMGFLVSLNETLPFPLLKWKITETISPLVETNGLPSDAEL